MTPTLSHSSSFNDNYKVITAAFNTHGNKNVYITLLINQSGMVPSKTDVGFVQGVPFFIIAIHRR